MSTTVLSEHQSACRAAHEQVQTLEHLYDHLVADEKGAAMERLQVTRRRQELSTTRKLLSAKLEELGLLRTEPDPEREGLLEIVTSLKRAFGDDDAHAASERLAAEEKELLRLSEQLAEHDDDDALAGSVADTRAAIARLESTSGGAD